MKDCAINELKARKRYYEINGNMAVTASDLILLIEDLLNIFEDDNRKIGFEKEI